MTAGINNKISLADLPGWLQALAACIPVVIYGIAYFLKWRRYCELGLPHALISIKLEDILFLVIAFVAAYYSLLYIGISEFAKSKFTLRAAYELFATLLVVVINATLIPIILIFVSKASCDVLPAALGVLQIVQLAFLVFLWRRDRANLHACAKTRLKFFVSWGVITLMLTVAQHGYISTNTGEYQIAKDSSLLVVDYLDSGLGIVKTISETNKSDILHVESGYQIMDITALSLETRNYHAIVVD